jgi:LacI family transcriptional regulator
VLSQSPGPTAVVCGDDITAKALLYAAARRGVTIPEDLSVASVLSSHRDDMDAGIAGIELPFRNLGVAGTMMLHARIASAQPLAAQIISPVEFVEGRTVAVHASTTPG